jgi:pimeloyl-ACP methyl ester carboxylesterase
MPLITINGTEIYYEEHSSGGETILFSHGLLWSGKMFHKQVEFLKDRYRVITYDHRGQGRSSKQLAPFDMETNYEDARALIEKLSLGRVHFMGISMGGFVGMRLAARNPELIKSLVLMETSADEEPNTFKYSLLNTIVKLAGVKAVTNKVMPIMFGRNFLADPHREQERDYWRQQLEMNEKGITKAVDAVIKRRGVFFEIPAIKCPTLVIVGDQDVATVPEKAIRIHNQIAGSYLKFIEGAGHSSCIEEPEQINNAIEEFLQRVCG